MFQPKLIQYQVTNKILPFPKVTIFYITKQSLYLVIKDYFCR